MKSIEMSITVMLTIVMSMPVTTVAQESDSLIYIREIRVTNESDLFAGSLEVEVHLYEQVSIDSIRFLGCSGEAFGLGSVNISDILYVDLQATIQKPDSGGFITVSDIADKNILMVVTEDDYGP